MAFNFKVDPQTKEVTSDNTVETYNANKTNYSVTDADIKDTDKKEDKKEDEDSGLEVASAIFNMASEE